VVLTLHLPFPRGPAAPGISSHGRCVSCPARLGCHSFGRGGLPPVLRGCGGLVVQEMVLPRGPTGVPLRGHGPDAGCSVEDMGLPFGLTPPTAAGPGPNSAYRDPRRDPGAPPTTGGYPGPGPGCAAHDGPQAHGHPAPWQQAREVEQKAGRAAVRPHLGGQAPPSLTGPPSRASSFRGRPDRRQPQPTTGRCLGALTARRARGPALGQNRRP